MDLALRHIPFSPPDIAEVEIQEVAAALRSGWITTGPRTKAFEQRIAAVCRTPRAVCLNSATAALELTLRVLGVGEGDEVIVPAYTYTATASVGVHVGARLVMVDCGADTYEMDYDAVEAAITERTKAILPVDLAGVVADYPRLLAIAEGARGKFRPRTDVQRAMGRIAVVADAAHAFGAQREGKMAGEWADFTCFSFHAVKNLTTAEGGAVVWRPIDGMADDDLYRRYQLLSLHGQSKDALAKTQLGGWEYDIVSPAYKCNMTDIMAAIGLRQLDRYDSLLARRREIIAAYDAALRPLGVETLRHWGDSPAFCGSGHLYLARLTGRTLQERNDFIVEMARRGVACNVHYKPLPMMTAYRQLGFDINDYPRAYARFCNEMTLPLHTLLSDDDVAYVCAAFKEVWG